MKTTAQDVDPQRRERAAATLFATTHWSVVLGAQQTHAPAAAEALETLCRTYWYPLYAYVRRRGYSADDSQDLVQGFFLRFLDKDYLADVNRAKGKFRSFLLASMKHYLANESDRVSAVKRGGRVSFLFLDDDLVEDRYRQEPATAMSPELVYERRWAIILLQRAMTMLETEYETSGRGRLFARLKDFLVERPADGAYEEAAAELHLSVSAVTSQMHRMRRRYRELVRLQVAHTVANPSEIDDEMRHLLGVFSGE